GIVLDTLESITKAPQGSPKGKPLGNVRYDVHRLFQLLQKKARERDERMDVHRLVRLEWQMLSLLDGRPAKPETLLDALSKAPEFLMNLADLLYPRMSGDEKREFSEEEKSRAENAYRLLSMWHKVPGLRDDGTVDEDELFAWLHKARALAK